MKIKELGIGYEEVEELVNGVKDQLLQHMINKQAITVAQAEKISKTALVTIKKPNKISSVYQKMFGRPGEKYTIMIAEIPPIKDIKHDTRGKEL